MDAYWNDLFLSRVQFGLTTSFHILWASFSVGLSLFLVLIEAMWLKTGDEDYYRHARFWGKFFLLIFGMGAATGLPLAFQFGANWQRFSVAAGGFIGNLISFEATMAFMLEAAFLGIMLFGWQRVSRGVHFLSTVMVALGTTLSAFWIMAANSWMQTPAGGHFENGRFIVTSYLEAIFNPDMITATSHMWVACVETALFVIGGLSAWAILKGRSVDFFYKSFRLAFFAAVLITPLQVFLGDASGLLIASHQPAKLAATEAHWETNPAGQPAAWKALIWPDEEKQQNALAIEIPYGLSLIITKSFTGQVRGLKEFPRAEQPPILIPFYSFRIMMGLGFGMFFLMLATGWFWFKGRLKPETITSQKKLLVLWALTVPTGFIAVVTGWMTREVGRQPWTIYGHLRTSEASSVLPSSAVGASLFFYAGLFAVMFLVFLFLARRIYQQGPEGLPSAGPAKE